MPNLKFPHSIPNMFFFLFQGFTGRKLLLFIENPFHEKEEGKHHILVYKIPRETKEVFVKTTETDKFTLICDVGTKNMVNVPFEEGEKRQFWDSDNRREQRWKKFVLPIMEFASNIVGAAGDIAGAV